MAMRSTRNYLVSRKELGPFTDDLEWLNEHNIDAAISGGKFKSVLKSTALDAVWRVHACAKHVDEHHCGEDPIGYPLRAFDGAFDSIAKEPVLGAIHRAEVIE